MNYEKPELTIVGRAIEAIQANEKSPIQPLDGLNQETVSAYEADE